ncbi:MAG TPA: efflux RND transporter periplasmic adaptor subunit [Candidatus Sulfotelmatobacter sp.]|nr:efflux RND transporter periplasmic adaptor subunit [Candidatus Sulfotelmatobacter sp.]
MKPTLAGLALAGLALVGLGALSGCKPAAAEPVPAAAPPVTVQVVQPECGPITRFVTLPGEIKPYQQATLFAKVSGYLKTIAVDKGDSVKAGALLAEIEVPELLAERAKGRAEVEVATLDYKRLSESQKQAPDLVVPQAVDDARGKLDIAKANLERIETLLNYAKIVAPFSGVVTRRFVDPGAFIPAATAGNATQSAGMLTLTDFNRVRLQVAVPEMEAALVAPEQPVSLTLEALPGRSFQGKVTRLAYALDEASKTMLAEIELPNPKLELRPGMYASVKIGIERKEQALLLPAEALVQEKAGAFLFTLADNKAKKMPVKIGFQDGQRVEIVSGLKLGQPVILAGKQPLSDAQPVRLKESQ